jgi:hypothetical protein
MIRSGTSPRIEYGMSSCRNVTPQVPFCPWRLRARDHRLGPGPRRYFTTVEHVWWKARALCEAPPGKLVAGLRDSHGADAGLADLLALVVLADHDLVDPAILRRPHVHGAILLHLCPGRKPPFWAVKRHARPYKSTIESRFTVENAKGA